MLNNKGQLSIEFLFVILIFLLFLSFNINIINYFYENLKTENENYTQKNEVIIKEYLDIKKINEIYEKRTNLYT